MHQQNKRTLSKILGTSVLLGAFIMSFSSNALAGSEQMMFKHKVNNVQCTSCHKQVGDAVSPDRCLACHQQEKLIAKTSYLNFNAELKNPKTGEMIVHTALVNPHDSYHFGKTESCFDCHREHKPSTNECQTCHDIKAWKMGSPR